MADIIRDATLRAQLAGADSFAQSAKKIEDAAAGMADAVTRTEQGIEKAGQKIVLTANEFQRWVERIDPATRATERYEKELEKLEQFRQAGLVGGQEYLRILELTRQRMDDATRRAEEASRGFGSWTRTLEFAKGALGALGLATTIESVIEFTSETFKSTAELGHQAAAAGVSAEALQAYRAAAVESGGSVEIADNAIRRFTRSMGDAQGTAGPARKALQELGFTAGDLAGGPEAFLPKVAKALLDITDVTKRARLETELFSRSGQQIEGSLAAWAEGTNTLVEHYKKLGVVIDEATIKRFEHSKAAWDLFWMGVQADIVSMFDILGRLDDALKHEENQTVTAMNARRAKGEEHRRAVMAGLPEQIELGAPKFREMTDTPAKKWEDAAHALEDYIKKLERAAQLAKLSREDAELQANLEEARLAKAKDTDNINAQLNTKEIERVTNATKAAQATREFNEMQKQGLQDLLHFYDEEARRFKEAEAKSEAFVMSRDQRIQDRVLKEIQSMGKETKMGTGFPTIDPLVRQLEERNKLAGMSRQEAEIQYQLDQESLTLNRELTDAEKEQITALIKQGQVIERNQKLREDFQADFMNWLDQVEQTGQVNFGNLFRSMLGTFRKYLNQMISDYLSSALFKTAPTLGGGGGFGVIDFLSRGIGSLFGMGGGGAGLGGFTGVNQAAGFGEFVFAAKGADVWAGQRVVVGEQGPESFVPAVPGRIVPTIGPTRTSTIHFAFNIDARGATPGMEERIKTAARDAVVEAAPHIIRASYGAVSQKLQNTGRGRLG